MGINIIDALFFFGGCCHFLVLHVSAESVSDKKVGQNGHILPTCLRPRDDRYWDSSKDLPKNLGICGSYTSIKN